MKYCVGSPKRGLLLKPIGEWDGNLSYEFVITGRLDSDYVKDTDTRRSVSGIHKRSNTQKTVIFSVTEAELVTAM
jgi:hypothetical protein